MAIRTYKTVIAKTYFAQSRYGRRVVLIHYPEGMTKEEAIKLVTGISVTDPDWFDVAYDWAYVMNLGSETAQKYSEDQKQLEFKSQKEFLDSKKVELIEVLRELDCQPLMKLFGMGMPAKLTTLHKFNLIPTCKNKVRVVKVS